MPFSLPSLAAGGGSENSPKKGTFSWLMDGSNPYCFQLKFVIDVDNWMSFSFQTITITSDAENSCKSILIPCSQFQRKNVIVLIGSHASSIHLNFASLHKFPSSLQSTLHQKSSSSQRTYEGACMIADLYTFGFFAFAWHMARVGKQPQD